MPNNIPLGNFDFVSQQEALSALQRNWQIGRIQTATLTTAFSASTIYGWVVDGPLNIAGGGGLVKIYDTTQFITIAGAGAAFFPMGMPTVYSPPGGACFAVTTSTGLQATIFYK